jgi:hypothetical protein
MASSSSKVSESPQQPAVVVPRRSPRIAARQSASTHEEHAARRPGFDDERKKTTGPVLSSRGKASLQSAKRKVAAHEGGGAEGGTPKKKIRIETKEPDSNSRQSDAIESEKSWEQLPAKLLAKIVPWIDSRAIVSARNVCRTWRLNIDSFVVLKESFTGDVLNTSVWKTDKLNTKIFKVDRPMRSYFRREAKKLLKFNQWSSLTTRQLLPVGTIISYMVRFPVSWGNETKFTVTGGAILKRSNLNYTPIELKPQDNSSFIWQRWDGNFHGLTYSVVRPGERWYSIAQEVVSDGVITYEEGHRMFKLPCAVPQKGIEGALLLQHLDVGSAVCVDIANLFIIKL